MSIASNFVLAGLILVTASSCSSGLPSERREPVETVGQFEESIAKGQCILYVDCVWNTDVMSFGQVFDEFAKRHPQFQTVRVLHLGSDVQGKELKLWTRIEKLWEENAIESGAYKNLNGAGRVVWFADGKVIDSQWGMNQDDAWLSEQTEKAFGSATPLE